MEKNIEDMEFEEAIEKLEQIVTAIGEGNLSLKEASNMYIKGMQLKKHCAKLLETIELKLNQISSKDDESDIIIEEKEVDL